MTVVALSYHDGHGNVEGDKMSVGVFAADEDVGDVGAGQCVVLREKPLGNPDGSQGDTVSHGWG